MNLTKANNYISSIEDKTKKAFVERVIENFIYFTTDEIINMVRESVKSAIEKYPKFNVMIPRGKIGSEHFLTITCKDLIKDAIQVINPDSYENIKLDNEHPILLIDDAIYTCIRVCKIVDKSRYYSNVKNKFIIATAFASHINTQVEEDFDAELFTQKRFDSLIPAKLFKGILPKMMGYRLLEYLNEILGCDSYYVLPIVLEHKIANSSGAYPFLENLLLKPISRKVIDDVTKEDIQQLLK